LSVRSLSKIAHSWTRGYIRVRRNMAQSDTDALWCNDAIEVRTGSFWRSQRNFAMELCNPKYEFEKDHTGILEACLRVMLWVTIRAITAYFSRVPAATWLYLESEECRDERGVSYRRMLVTEGIRRQRFELAI